MFNKKSFSEEYRQERIQRSLKQLEAGRLPLDAEWRLKNLCEKGRLFTSNLSPSELALIASTGIRPLAQVMGASTYKIAQRSSVPIMSQELVTVSHGHSHARLLAMGRLQQEAKMIGADGVVGVHLATNNGGLGDDVYEYVAIGTAVKLPFQYQSPNPFIAAVSIQELWGLLQTGHMPVGFVFGKCIYYHVASLMNQWLSGSMVYTPNAELTDYTSAVYKARSQAMQQMELEARSLHAEGTVGMTIKHDLKIQEVELERNGIKSIRRDLLISFTASGTAIVNKENILLHMNAMETNTPDARVTTKFEYIVSLNNR